MMKLRFLVLLVLGWNVCQARNVGERHFPFIQEAIKVSKDAEYDYIVIGGGGAGCPLAATLSSAAKVLVLERGASPYGNPNITRIEGFETNLRDSEGPSSPVQVFTSTDGAPNFRGRVLGGGTSVNAGFYSRANKEYIREAGWDEALAKESYEWVESVVPSLRPPETYQAVVRQSLLDAGVTPDNGASFDHVVGTKTSGTLFDSNGFRHPSSDLFFRANPKNLDVFIHATVHRVLFEGGRAIGALYTDSLGEKHVAKLNGKSSSEVILSAGALGSPQLLLLSGIGPKKHLDEKGIPVVHDLAGVGQKAADNPQANIRIPSPTPISPTSREQVVGITSFNSFIKGGSRTIGVPEGSYLGAIVAEVWGPLSLGQLELDTLDPKDNPKVTYNYFKEPKDLELCVAGVNTLEEMILSDAFKHYRFGNQSLPSGGTAASPKRLQAQSASSVNASITEFCLKEYTTGYHYHGGCNVGSVIDKEHRVLGVEGLRVMDTSTFDKSPGTNPQATVMMMGRYLGVKILKGRSSSIASM